MHFYWNQSFVTNSTNPRVWSTFSDIKHSKYQLCILLTSGEICYAPSLIPTSHVLQKPQHPSPPITVSDLSFLQLVGHGQGFSVAIHFQDGIHSSKVDNFNNNYQIKEPNSGSLFYCFSPGLSMTYLIGFRRVIRWQSEGPNELVFFFIFSHVSLPVLANHLVSFPRNHIMNHRPTNFYPAVGKASSFPPVLECSVQDSLHSIFECSHCCPRPLQPVNVCVLLRAVPPEKKQDIKGGVL